MPGRCGRCAGSDGSRGKSPAGGTNFRRRPGSLFQKEVIQCRNQVRRGCAGNGMSDGACSRSPLRQSTEQPGVFRDSRFVFGQGRGFSLPGGLPGRMVMRMGYRPENLARPSALVRAWVVVAALLAVLVCSAGVRALHDHSAQAHDRACEHSACVHGEGSAADQAVSGGSSGESELPGREGPCELCLKLDLAASSVAVGLRVDLIPPMRMGWSDRRTAYVCVVGDRLIHAASARGPPSA